jgi:hypothetical protein
VIAGVEDVVGVRRTVLAVTEGSAAMRDRRLNMADCGDTRVRGRQFKGARVEKEANASGLSTGFVVMDPA